MAALDTLAAQVKELLDEWDNPAVERDIFGTADPALIAEQVDAFCREHLGRAIRRPVFYRSSVGAVFGLELEDGEQVVLKAHQPDVSISFLRATDAVQRKLAQQRYPCPEPLLSPTPFGQGSATVERMRAKGSYANPHQPWVRQQMAAALARQVEIARGSETHPGFREGRWGAPLPPDRLWPKPHSVIFDFEATAAGAEWIDELGWHAKRALDQSSGDLVVGHCDWSSKHFRFVGRRITAIYDWDSLRADPEPVIVGRAAKNHCAVYDTPLSGKVPHIASWDEFTGFVSDYEAARVRPFTAAERRTLSAASLYSLAYSARCSHALEPHLTRETGFPPDNWRHALAAYGERLLRLLDR